MISLFSDPNLNPSPESDVTDPHKANYGCTVLFSVTPDVSMKYKGQKGNKMSLETGNFRSSSLIRNEPFLSKLLLGLGI